MEDKDLMENHLCLVKGICDLYLHGMIESSTAEVHKQFQNALNEELNIQNKLYNLMKERNWYQTDEADMSKISIAKQKFNQN
ncbi:MAG: spore coat protein [Clostridia bacterium]|nr:spore coat protein [Clostridia bacterium]